MFSSCNVEVILLVSHGATAAVVLSPLYEVARSHSATQHSAGLLWTSDRPVTGIST
jgi:hypothetical protein